MKKPDLDMTLQDCLERFPQLEDTLYSLIKECVYCQGFKDKPLREVLKAHRLDAESSLRKLLKALEERGL